MFCCGASVWLFRQLFMRTQAASMLKGATPIARPVTIIVTERPSVRSRHRVKTLAAGVIPVPIIRTVARPARPMLLLSGSATRAMRGISIAMETALAVNDPRQLRSRSARVGAFVLGAALWALVAVLLFPVFKILLSYTL